MGTLEELIETRPGIKLELGQHVQGTIVSTSSQQSNDFDTQKPAFWDDGRPKMLAVFVLRLDDGSEQSLYVQWWGSQRKSMEAGIKQLERAPREGDRMRVTYVRDETQQDREARGVKRNPPIPAKLYRYEFQAGAPVVEPVPDEGIRSRP